VVPPDEGPFRRGCRHGTHTLEIDRSLALRMRPVQADEDSITREGNGVLVVDQGRRLLQLKGTAHEIGFQQGRLLSANVNRLVQHVVFGVGLIYSMEKGSWFMADARQLIERQRPHIEEGFIEEMRGLAEGAELPLEWIQMANIFPEFFHCSGTALFSEATRGGRLLHARVLDYMTDVGLQDEAVVIAVEKEGARRWVNVGYAGFIGSVTGMNESRVAIGEMGGGGEGDWDGTPMSFLVRGALEQCDSLEEVLVYFREHPRTCEYYYVVSDGNTRNAAGLKATPEILDIDRPVAMGSNLHNAVFAPEERMLWVANAGRHTPACAEPYAEYAWDDLFTPAD